ncbi:MAG: hypothetical protein U9Q15_03450 [Patescibacteria group bacterium]|nr:hypothetical protein [Patescibacteria group bacterium]
MDLVDLKKAALKKLLNIYQSALKKAEKKKQEEKIASYNQIIKEIQSVQEYPVKYDKVGNYSLVIISDKYGLQKRYFICDRSQGEIACGNGEVINFVGTGTYFYEMMKDCTVKKQFRLGADDVSIVKIA